MCFGEVDHFATMVAGCENISSGNILTLDGKYATAVLKLHAQPNNSIVHGNEGFIDTVKRGANSIKEWFLSLLKAIGNFLKEITGRNKRQREEDARTILKQKEAVDKQKADEYEEKLIEVFKASFAEPLRLSEQVYQDIQSSGYLDSDTFRVLNLGNMRIDSGFSAIKALNFEAKDVADSDTKDVVRELDHLEKAIDVLVRQSEQEVNKWADDDVQEAQRSDIAKAAFLLKKFTQVYGWYEDGLNRYYKNAAKIKP